MVRNRGTPPLADRPSVSSVHMRQAKEKRRWTWSTMRPAVGPWTMSTVHREPHGVNRAMDKAQ